MSPKIKCTIRVNEELVQSFSQVPDFEHLFESLNKFELELNSAITKLIEDTGDIITDCNVDDDEENSDGDDVQEQYSPKKKKKS